MLENRHANKYCVQIVFKSKSIKINNENYIIVIIVNYAFFYYFESLSGFDGSLFIY